MLMIGEIRDEVSAAVAVRAALTGHLVLATLHTGSAGGVVLRLENLGISRKLIASVLRGVVVQELNSFKGTINLIADVAEPLADLGTAVEKVLTEDELETHFEHNTNFRELLQKTLNVLKRKHTAIVTEEETFERKRISKLDRKKNIKIEEQAV